MNAITTKWVTRKGNNVYQTSTAFGSGGAGEGGLTVQVLTFEEYETMLSNIDNFNEGILYEVIIDAEDATIGFGDQIIKIIQLPNNITSVDTNIYDSYAWNKLIINNGINTDVRVLGSITQDDNIRFIELNNKASAATNTAFWFPAYNNKVIMVKAGLSKVIYINKLGVYPVEENDEDGTLYFDIAPGELLGTFILNNVGEAAYNLSGKLHVFSTAQNETSTEIVIDLETAVRTNGSSLQIDNSKATLVSNQNWIGTTFELGTYAGSITHPDTNAKVYDCLIGYVKNISTGTISVRYELGSADFPTQYKLEDKWNVIFPNDSQTYFDYQSQFKTEQVFEPLERADVDSFFVEMTGADVATVKSDIWYSACNFGVRMTSPWEPLPNGGDWQLSFLNTDTNDRWFLQRNSSDLELVNFDGTSIRYIVKDGQSDYFGINYIFPEFANSEAWKVQFSWNVITANSDPNVKVVFNVNSMYNHMNSGTIYRWLSDNIPMGEETNIAHAVSKTWENAWGPANYENGVSINGIGVNGDVAKPGYVHFVGYPDAGNVLVGYIDGEKVCTVAGIGPELEIVSAAYPVAVGQNATCIITDAAGTPLVKATSIKHFSLLRDTNPIGN